MSLTAKQIILFGSPGTGKSRHIVKELLPELGINPQGPDCKRVVFHPEYAYGDFMGKLMPLSEGDKVQYRFYAGHFMKALGRAYRNLLNADQPNNAKQVALVIDEINRGNSAAIFGSTFQLLDRASAGEKKGWSEYRVQLSEMEFAALESEIGVERRSDLIGKGDDRREENVRFAAGEKEYEERGHIMDILNIEDRHIRIPPNLSLLATMNTSDNSIYHMDAAFKRRWAWQYMDIDSELISAEGPPAFESRSDWEQFVDKVNAFIRHHHKYVRRVEDKQLGHWFLKGKGENGSTTFSKTEIQNKVMFFLWDSVFTTSKKPLANDLFGIDESELVTFGHFADKVDDFIEEVSKWEPAQESE